MYRQIALYESLVTFIYKISYKMDVYECKSLLERILGQKVSPSLMLVEPWRLYIRDTNSGVLY